MCTGGGSSGPSAEELAAQEQLSIQRTKAEIERIRAEQEAEKQKENAALLAEQASQANKDAERRARNRTLLAGLEEEEDGFELEDPSSQSTAKRKRATLISSFGE